MAYIGLTPFRGKCMHAAYAWLPVAQLAFLLPSRTSVQRVDDRGGNGAARQPSMRRPPVLLLHNTAADATHVTSKML